MNDFTKEELEDIRESLRSYLQQDHCDNGWANGIRTLEDKIQSMIDNYCEHDWQSGCASHDCHAQCVWCPKCKKDLK